MPGFFAKRGTTMPPNIRDDQSDGFSHGSTLKMETSDGRISTRTRYKRPRACILVGIGLLFLLAGISVAAGICYINHIGTIDQMTRWADEGRVLPPHSTGSVEDGLQKRQMYSYGHHPSANVTTSLTVTVGTTAMPTESFSQTAPGIPITIIPSLQSSTGSAITQTVTSESDFTVSPSVQSSSIPKNVTITVGVNNTFTFTPSLPTQSPATDTLTVTTTGVITETISSEEVSTITKTSFQPVTVSASSNSTLTESSLSEITLTVPGTVVPVPASTISTGTAAGVTGGPPTWTSNSSGWNLTVTSFFGPSESTETVSITLTTSGNSSTTCTESFGTTATSNDAVSATVTDVSTLSSSTFSSPALSTVVPTTFSQYPKTSTSTSTCTESETPIQTPQSSAVTSGGAYTSTETETLRGHTTVVTITVTTAKTTTVSEAGSYSIQGLTTTLSKTLTSATTRTVTVTQTLESSSAGGTCAPVATVTVTATTIQTVTAMPDSGQLTVKAVMSMATSSPVTSVLDIPLISISPNTTVVVSVPEVTLLITTKTIDFGMTTFSNEAVTASAPASFSSVGLLSHSVSDLTTSHATTLSHISPQPSVGTGTAASMHGTGTAASTIFSTQTVVASHTSTGYPIVPVSAGERRGVTGFGGKGNSSGAAGTCVFMLIALVSLLLI